MLPHMTTDEYQMALQSLGEGAIATGRKDLHEVLQHQPPSRLGI